MAKKKNVKKGKGNKTEASSSNARTPRRVAPTSSRIRGTAATAAPKQTMIFDRENYILMAAGAALVLLGLLLMTGGSMPDPNTWDPDIIYSKRITLLAPLVMLAGLILEIYAIFKKKATVE